MKKKYETLVFVYIFLSIFCSIMLRSLSSLDELWQYGFGRNIATGILPYKDMNMIVTPFSMWVLGLFIRLLGEEIYIYRLLGVLVCATAVYICYKILILLQVKKRFVFCMIAYICAFYCVFFTYDYNFLNMTLQVLIIYLYLNRLLCTKAYWKSDFMLFLTGICSGLPIITKQTTGLTLMFSSILVYYIIWKKDSAKKKLLFGIAITLPGVVFFVWLIVNQILDDFIFYSVKGLGKFSHKVTLGDFLFRSGIINTCIGCGTILICFLVISKIIKNKGRIERNVWIIIFILAMGGMIVIYPITDSIHVSVAIFPIILLGILLLADVMNKQSDIRMEVLIFAIFLGLGLPIYINIDENSKWSELKHMKYVLMDRGLEENINKVNDYMERLETDDIYIVDASACLYKIPMDMYIKDYDLFLNGHWGTESPLEVVERLKDREGYIFILKEDYLLNWQVPKEAVTYVRNEFKKIDEVEQFEVYTCECSEVLINE